MAALSFPPARAWIGRCHRRRARGSAFAAARGFPNAVWRWPFWFLVQANNGSSCCLLDVSNFVTRFASAFSGNQSDEGPRQIALQAGRASFVVATACLLVVEHE